MITRTHAVTSEEPLLLLKAWVAFPDLDLGAVSGVWGR